MLVSRGAQGASTSLRGSRALQPLRQPADRRGDLLVVLALVVAFRSPSPPPNPPQRSVRCRPKGPSGTSRQMNHARCTMDSPGCGPHVRPVRAGLVPAAATAALFAAAGFVLGDPPPPVRAAGRQLSTRWALAQLIGRVAPGRAFGSSAGRSGHSRGTGRRWRSARQMVLHQPFRRQTRASWSDTPVTFREQVTRTRLRP